MKCNIWQSVRRFVRLSQRQLFAISGLASTSEKLAPETLTSTVALMSDDHHGLVCSRCWEQLFKGDRLWTQLGLPRSEPSDIARRMTGEELLSAAQAPTNCNFCQLVMHCIQSRFPKAFAPDPGFSPFPMMALKVGPSTPLIIRFDAGKDQGFDVFNLVVSDEQGTFNLDSFVLNREEGTNPHISTF